MNINNCHLRIKNHVYLRAIQRGIHPDDIKKIILNGKQVRFGKHGIKFIKKGKRTLICVGEIKGNVINIFTIEEG